MGYVMVGKAGAWLWLCLTAMPSVNGGVCYMQFANMLLKFAK